jgi:hypothetical protein
MIWLALIAGIIAGQFFPDQFRERVRGVAGKARDAVFGLRPAPEFVTQSAKSADGLQSEQNQHSNAQNRNAQTRASDHNVDLSPSDHSSEVRPVRPNKPIQIGRALANLASFLWRWKWAILVVCFFSLAVGLMRGCAGPLDFGKSRGQIALERELAEANAAVKEHEARLAELSRDLAVNTERDRARRAAAIAEAEQDISNAESQVDPDALYDAYERGYLCLLDPSACPGGGDPAPRRVAPMRGAGADPV